MALTGKFIADFASFYDAVEKADTKLKTLGEGAERVGPKLNRMVDDFSGRKVIQDATLMVEAIERIGGVSKLTEGELLKVGARAEEAASKMKALGMDVPKGLTDIADAAKKIPKPLDDTTKAGKDASGSFDALALSAAKYIGGFLTAQAVISGVSKAWDTLSGFMTDSIAAASGAEDAASGLVAALRAQDTAMPSVIDAYDGYAAALEATTRYGDDVVQSAMGILVTVGNVMPKDMEKATRATTDLAAALHIDLNAAAGLVAKAAVGSTAALDKMGVQTTTTGGHVKDFGGILDAINDKVGGQAVAAADTYAGRLAQMANAWDNVKESVGRAITTNATVLSAIDLVTQGIIGQTGELNQNERVMNLISDAIIVTVKASALLLEGIAMLSRHFAGMLAEAAAVTKGLRFLVDGMIWVTEAAAAMGQTAAKIALPKMLELRSGMTKVVEASEAGANIFVDVSAAAHGLSGKASELARNLETTRGKTVDVTRAGVEASSVWQRNTVNVKDQSKALEAAAKAQAEYLKSLRDISDNLSGGGVIDKANLWMQALRDTVPVSQMTKDKQIALNKVLGEALDAYAALGETAPQAMLDVWAATIPATEATIKFGGAVADLPTAKVELFARQWAGMMATPAGQFKPKAEADEFGKTLTALSDSLQQVGDKWSTVAQGMILQMANVHRLWKGGFKTQAIGQAMGAIGDMIPVTDSLGNSLARGALQGAAMGSAFGPIGMGVGAAAGAIMAYADNSKTLKETNHARQAFIEAHGGLALFHQELVATLGTQGEYLTQNLLHAQTAGGLAQAQDAITAALAEQDATMATLTETAQRYGFTLEELGPAMQRQELDKQAQQLFKDWEVLNAAGIDTVNIAGRMSDEVSDYIQTAVAMGTEVPEAMRPMLQTMVEMGTLTDAQGNAITDLEDSGVSFAMTMSEGFNKLIKSVAQLTEAIGRGLGIAVESTSDKLAHMPRHVNVDVIYKDPGFQAPPVVASGSGGDELEGFQEGTEGRFRNFGRGTPVMLHGMEAVVPFERHSSPGPPLAAGPPLLPATAGPAAAPVVINLTIHAEGAFFDTPGSLQKLADKVNAALTAKYALTHRMRAA